MAGRAHIENFVADFEVWDGPRGGPTSADPLAWPGYAATLARGDGAESVVTGRGNVVLSEGRSAPVAIIDFDFDFIGGSLGVATGERIVRAFERARAERLAVFTVARSGGARMQEGMVALIQMARVADAARRHAEAGLVQVAYLESPTTGGVYASLASLADFVWAAPGAAVGFAGHRVVAQTTGVPLPPGAHTAESALAVGIIDAVLDAGAARAQLATLLRLATPVLSPLAAEPDLSLPDPSPVEDPWAAVIAARDPARPSGAAWLPRLVPTRVNAHGDRAGGVDDVVMTGVGLTADGQPAAFIALDRHTDDGRPRPAGYRAARRMLALAARLSLPVITIVDTPGADPSDQSERTGVAGEIARTFAAITGHPAPTVSLVVGEGGSGGALAFAAADRLYLLEGAIFSVIGPEGAAAILERDSSKARHVTPLLKLTGPDLVALGVIDGVVPETQAIEAVDIALRTARPGDGRARFDAATHRWIHSS